MLVGIKPRISWANAHCTKSDAAQKFQKAYEIAKVPTLAVWAARSLVMRGQLVAASEFNRQASQLSPNELWIGNAQQEAQGDAARELAALIPRIPRVRVHIEGAFELRKRRL